MLDAAGKRRAMSYERRGGKWQIANEQIANEEGAGAASVSLVTLGAIHRVIHSVDNFGAERFVNDV